jgi:enamine deaminase RidA (YjgF/YER057c/UK114 family)
MGESTDMATAFNPPDLWQPFGAFSMMQIQGSGRIVHLKGQVALDRDGAIVGPNDLRVQLRQVLENIQATLAAVGGEMRDIISLTQYVTDIEQFMRAGDIRKMYFAAPYPVTTTVEITRLYHPDLMIEITATAEIPLERFRPPQP